MQLSINKVVLLTTGTGELSWHLIRKFRQQYQHILIIITQQPPNLMQRLKFLPYTVKQTMKFFVRYLLLGQRNYLPVQPPLFSDVFYSDDINAEIVYEQIKTFNPDLICIAGTKLVKDHILSLAKLCLNLHHGYLPYYRGVSSADWVSLQKNFDYYYVSVHEAVVALDSGSIFAAKQVKPYLAESYKDFKRRIKLFGAEIMLHVCQNLQTIKPVPQPDNISHHNYRHKEKEKAFSICAKREYNSSNLRRYVINEGDGGEGRIFHIVNRCLQKQEEENTLQPGLYIVNYHYITNHEDLKSDYRIPNIFTSREKFLLHLKFYANEFELVSMSDGLKLLQEQGKRLTKRYLVISFDDSFDSAKEVLPDINALGIEPTFFVNSDPLIDSKPLHNHQELICVHYSASYKSLNLKTLRDKYHYMLQNDCLNSSSNNI
jgi:methionyl-tRNA formyltransferase